jgi:hypothetical protein
MHSDFGLTALARASSLDTGYWLPTCVG